jgi:hypothetical protein
MGCPVVDARTVHTPRASLAIAYHLAQRNFELAFIASNASHSGDSLEYIMKLSSEATEGQRCLTLLLAKLLVSLVQFPIRSHRLQLMDLSHVNSLVLIG